MANYNYAIQTPSGVHRGYSALNPDELRARGFSEAELTRLLASDPGPMPVRGAGGDWSKSNFSEAMTNWEMANEAFKQGQTLLAGGPGSQGQVEFNKAASGFSKYGGDWVPAITMLGGGAVIGGGIAAGGALGATEGTAAGAGWGGTAATATPYVAAESGMAAPTALAPAAGLTGGLSETGAPPMGDFFSDLDWSAIDSGDAVAPWTTDPSLQDLGGNVGQGNWWDSLPPQLANLIPRMFGGGGGPKGGGGGGSNFNPWALGAGLGAVAYARNQDPFDMTNLQADRNSINDAGLTGQFDINTGLGRSQLTSDLSRRGVGGSSFANQDLASFDMTRDVGRQNLLTGGAMSRASIDNQIMQAQIAQQKNKNDLYGRALLALSGVGAPPNPLANLFGG